MRGGGVRLGVSQDNPIARRNHMRVLVAGSGVLGRFVSAMVEYAIGAVPTMRAGFRVPAHLRMVDRGRGAMYPHGLVCASSTIQLLSLIHI